MGTESTTTSPSADDASTSTGGSATGASQRESLTGNLLALARGGSAGDSRLLARVVRSTTYLRRTGGFQPAVLDSLVQQAFDADSTTLALLLRAIPKIVEPASPSAPASPSSSSSSSSAAAAASSSQSAAVPTSDDTTGTATAETTNEDSAAESNGSAGLRILATCDSVVRQHIQLYLLLVVVIALIDSKEVEAAVPVALLLAELVQLHGNRRLSPLVSKAFFYFSRVFELAGRFGDIHETLLKAHRTAGLRHDEETQLTVLNVLLRQHLQSKQYDQAHHLLSNTKFNESGVSANQGARYLYYKARVLAIQLDYREADQLLSSAMAKAPQTGALGFRVTVQKWACLVQLLLGQIPEKRIFRRPAFSTALKPYRQLTLAVHFGDLTYFQQVITDHRQTFERDDTLALISRLRVSVIKAGLRKIGLAYTRISLAHIQQKLHLDSLEGAEFAVAKAIRDGVIDGAINAEQGYLITNAHADVYSTPEPMDAFHSRIQTCIELHNSAVQGMRFPPEILKASIRTRAGSDEEDIDPESLLDEDLDDDL